MNVSLDPSTGHGVCHHRAMVNRTASKAHTPISSARRPLRVFTRWPRATDAVLAIVVFLTAVFVSFEDPDQDFAIRAVNDVPIAAYIVIAVASAALYWRRSRPVGCAGGEPGPVDPVAGTRERSLLDWPACRSVQRWSPRHQRPMELLRSGGALSL